MEKFELLVFLAIKGIGSASGIVHTNNSLYIISDNSTYLYEYQLANNHLNKIALVENAQQNIQKKEKPDYESITLKGNKLHLFGSGSTQNRNKTASYHLEKKKIKNRDLTGLYQTIKKQFKIADDELNIEGTILKGDHLLLFQRGNGANAKNGIITHNENTNELSFIPISLPKIKHVETSFTDAVLIDDKIYFLASAEDTNSTYHDGEVLGSIIGIIDSKTLELEKTIQISDKHKFEGLTFYSKNENQIEFLLCEDNDTDDLNATIYKLILDSKKQD